MARIDLFKVRRDLSTIWTATNPILEDGEEGFETDTRLSKHGDGATPWNSLSYDAGSGGGSGNIDGGNASSNYGGTVPIDGGGA